MSDDEEVFVLQYFDSEAQKFVSLDENPELDAAGDLEVLSFEVVPKPKRPLTRSLSIVKKYRPQQDEARANACQCIHERSSLLAQNRLITKFLLWATASAASAIYAFNPVSAIGSYCLYCSAILRTARLAVVFHMFGQKTRWADDPSLDAKMEDFAYIL